MNEEIILPTELIAGQAEGAANVEAEDAITLKLEIEPGTASGSGAKGDA